MRRIFAAVILLYVASASWASTEYLRPTADSFYNAAPCNAGTFIDDSPISGVYSGKSGAGPTGTANLLAGVYGSKQYFSGEVYTAFQSATKTYTALTINISAATSHTGAAGVSSAYYSTNSGSSWTALYSTSGTTSQTTYSASITGTAMSGVKVVICASSGTSTSTVNNNVYDIWTAGTYGTTSGFITPRIIGQLHRNHNSLNLKKEEFNEIS
jgi:hypothetical protein